MKSLERNLEKPDWKQWLPLWGVYQIEKDLSENNPTILDEEYGSKMLVGAIAVHALYAMAATSGVLYWLRNLID